MTPMDFLQIKMLLSARFRFSETSGLRSVSRNATVGGSTQSRHLYWLASDVVLDAPDENHAFCAEAKRQGLVAVDEGDHIHLQVP